MVVLVKQLMSQMAIMGLPEQQHLLAQMLLRMAAMVAAGEAQYLVQVDLVFCKETLGHLPAHLGQLAPLEFLPGSPQQRCLEAHQAHQEEESQLLMLLQ